MKKTFLILLLFYAVGQAQWVQMSTGLPGNDGVHSLASSGNIIFAGVEHIQTISGRGVYISTNNGTNWTNTTFINGPIVYAFAISGNYIFAGSMWGVYLTTDNGTTWIQTLLNNVWVISLAVNGNNVFAGTYNSNNGVYLSTDKGSSWTQTSLNNRVVFSLTVSGNNVFAGTNSGVFLSTNNGTTWAQTSLNNGYVNVLAINGNTIYAGIDSSGLYSSTNNGTTWAQTSLNNVRVYSFAASGNNIFVGTYYQGVFVSNDNGITWLQRNEGLGNLLVWSLCITNNYIFAGKLQGGVSRRPLSELTGIRPISNEVPNQFHLYQNYPNPFNPSTKIRFDIPAQSVTQISNLWTQLSVYNSLGQQISTLVNQQLKTGTYEVEWDASNYPTPSSWHASGVYYYKLTAGDFTETKRMVLIK